MILTRTPLRISLAGGGTDIPSFYRKNDFGAVCSFAIQKYVYITLKDLPEIFPYRFKCSYSKTEFGLVTDDIKHPIIREAFNGVMKNADMSSMADIPSGTGMGSSSAFTVGLVNAINVFNKFDLNKDEMARISCELEIERLKEPIGKQDQYAASLGGFNYIQFHEDESVAHVPVVMSVDREKKLFDNLMLFYLGGDRSASAILSSQKGNLDDLLFLRKSAKEVEWSAQFGSLDDIGLILDETWERKKRLSPHITGSEVDDALGRAKKAGAIGGKLLGAGGTGFILLYVRPEHKQYIRTELASYKEVDVKLDTEGTKAYELF